MFSKSGPTTKQVTQTLNEFIVSVILCTLRLIESFFGKLLKCQSGALKPSERKYMSLSELDVVEPSENLFS